LVCGRAGGEIDRMRARTGRPALGADALACGQRCAIALVEREIASASQVIARIDPPGASAGEGDELDARAQVPRLAAYVAVMSIT
jgi:hypothetical protein